MNLLKQSTVALAAAAMLGALPLQQARANISPAGTSPVVTAVSGGFTWDYDALLDAAQQLQTGDFFTIYDFGVGSLVSAPVGWTMTTDPLAPVTINGTLVNGTAVQTSALNYTFTYSGATVIGPFDLGHFVLFSTVGTQAFAAWGASAHDILHPGNVDVNLTQVGVPVTTPEPATLVLLGTGMVGLVGVARRRKTAV